MSKLEKAIKGLEQCISTDKTCFDCPYEGTACTTTLNSDALALLKEQQQQIWEFQDQVEYLTDKLKDQEAVVRQWKKEIADNQLAHAPKDSHEFMSLNEHLENEYKRGIWDGLQIAWDIISEGR